MKRQVKETVAVFESAGVAIEEVVVNHGHAKLRWRHGSRTGTYCCGTSPSCHRAMKNLRAAARRIARGEEA